jgi:hypothetical protein
VLCVLGPYHPRMLSKIASCLVVFFVLTGCSSSTPAAKLSTASSCGVAYTLQHDGSTIQSGSCAGMIPPTPEKITVRRAHQFSITVEHEESGALDQPIPLPANTAVKVISRRGPVIRYTAQTLGTVYLVSHHARYCIGTDPKIGSCAAFQIHVVH